MSSGNDGCKCINQTSVLSSLQDRHCTTATGEPGVLTIGKGGNCLPYNYGSDSCLQHDYLYNPLCQGSTSSANTTTNNKDAKAPPPWCIQSWCYINTTTCKRQTNEELFLSTYFPQQDIHHSYSKCNSTNFFSTGFDPLSSLGGINLTLVVPTFQFPVMNKRLVNGTVLHKRTSDNRYYFDDSIPFGGIYIDYIHSMMEISNGDIANVTFTHTSRASLKRYPRSSYTAAVQDVENGLVDMAVGPFWITDERLKMTTFTVPLVYDKTVLVVPKPNVKSGLAYETEKVLEPFTLALWLVCLAIIFVAALLSVWFSNRERVARKRYGVRLSNNKTSWKQRKIVYLRLLLDNFLEKGMFFFSSGIEQDVGASLPHKVLMFGFGFFILIAVSTYVANLAAFLTRSEVDSVEYETIQEVVANQVPICGHPALEEEIRMKWPEAKWIFPTNGFSGPDGMFEAYARGDCNVLAVGREDTVMNRDIVAKVCENELVYTESVITENPIAFPIRPQLASAFSYWMYRGEKTYGVELETVTRRYIQENNIKMQCEIELSKLNTDKEQKFVSVSTDNMILPILAFMICAIIAVVLQFIHERRRKKGLASSFGRHSSLGIYNGMSKADKDEIMGTNGDRVQKTGDMGTNDEEDDKYEMPLTKKISWNKSPIDDDAGTSQLSDINNTGAAVENSVPMEAGDSQRSETHKPVSIYRGSNISVIDKAALSNITSDDICRKSEASTRNRIDELVKSGELDAVLDSYDLLQAWAKLRKNKNFKKDK